MEMRIMCEGGGIFLKKLGPLRKWCFFCEMGVSKVCVWIEKYKANFDFWNVALLKF